MMKSIALKNKNITYELVLYLGIILLAALLRFPQLGNIPLNDVEAKLALSSLEIQKGAAVTQSDQPLYVCLTSILFILASNNFTARIVSAITGCLFAITPFFFRKWIGRSEALLIGLFFAFDPALISISRQADSRMMSLFFIVIFIASLLISKKIFAGIIGGLLILCGVPFWQLSIVLLISFFLYFQLSKDKKKIIQKLKAFIINIKNESHYFLLGFTVSILLIGTRLFSRLDLLNLLPQSFISLIHDWLIQGQLFNQISLLIIFFLSCYPLIFLLSLYGVIKGIFRKGKFSFFVLILFLISFLFFLAKPGAKPADLYIIIIPIYYFAAQSILAWVEIIRKYFKESLLIGIPIICLLGFIWLAILRILNLPIGSLETAQMFIALIGSLLLLGLIIVLIGWGWSLKAALSGLSLGIIFILMLFQISVSFHATGMASKPEAELWWLNNYFKGSESLTTTVEDISEWNIGYKNRIDVALIRIDSPSIEWALREQSVTKYDLFPLKESPSIIITNGGREESFKTLYRGQKFSLHSYPIWTANIAQSLTSIDYYRWVFLRDGFITNNEAELWARTDLFVGNNLKFEINN